MQLLLVWKIKKSCRKEDVIERIKEESKNAKLDSVIVSIAIGYSAKNKKYEDILKTYKEADNQLVFFIKVHLIYTDIN